jgi:hypothetical protein
MLFLDGLNTENKYGKTRFEQTIAPSQQELTNPVHTISHRVAYFLERQGGILYTIIPPSPSILGCYLQVARWLVVCWSG